MSAWAPIACHAFVVEIGYSCTRLSTKTNIYSDSTKNPLTGSEEITWQHPTKWGTNVIVVDPVRRFFAKCSDFISHVRMHYEQIAGAAETETLSPFTAMTLLGCREKSGKSEENGGCSGRTEDDLRQLAFGQKPA